MIKLTWLWRTRLYTKIYHVQSAAFKVPLDQVFLDFKSRNNRRFNTLSHSAQVYEFQVLEIASGFKAAGNQLAPYIPSD